MSKDKPIINEGLFIVCRECGCEYIESKDWFLQNNRTSCPICKSILKIE